MNLGRAFPRTFVEDQGFFPRLGKIEQPEMDRTFNNGLGMVAIAGRDQADAVVKYLRVHKQRAFIIGEIARGARGVTIA